MLFANVLKHCLLHYLTIVESLIFSYAFVSLGCMVAMQYVACLCNIAACLSGNDEVAELAHCTDNIAQVAWCT
jgi:hypothetical protein